jgi:hypothetical protein
MAIPCPKTSSTFSNAGSKQVEIKWERNAQTPAHGFAQMLSLLVKDISSATLPSAAPQTLPLAFRLDSDCEA